MVVYQCYTTGSAGPATGMFYPCCERDVGCQVGQLLDSSSLNISTYKSRCRLLAFMFMGMFMDMYKEMM